MPSGDIFLPWRHLSHTAWGHLNRALIGIIYTLYSRLHRLSELGVVVIKDNEGPSLQVPCVLLAVLPASVFSALFQKTTPTNLAWQMSHKQMVTTTWTVGDGVKDKLWTGWIIYQNQSLDQANVSDYTLDIWLYYSIIRWYCKPLLHIVYNSSLLIFYVKSNIGLNVFHIRVVY